MIRISSYEKDLVRRAEFCQTSRILANENDLCQMRRWFFLSIHSTLLFPFPSLPFPSFSIKCKYASMHACSMYVHQQSTTDNMPPIHPHSASTLPSTHSRCRYVTLGWNSGCICPLRYVSAHMSPRSKCCTPMVPCGPSSPSAPFAAKTPSYCRSGSAMTMGVAGACWKPSWPFHVMFWMDSSVPLLMMIMSKSPLDTSTRFVASMTCGRTCWIGSAERSPSPSGPPV